MKSQKGIIQNMVPFKFATIVLLGLNLGNQKAYFALSPSHAEDLLLVLVLFPYPPLGFWQETDYRRVCDFTRGEADIMCFNKSISL